MRTTTNQMADHGPHFGQKLFRSAWSGPHWLCAIFRSSDVVRSAWSADHKRVPNHTSADHVVRSSLKSGLVCMFSTKEIERPYTKQLGFVYKPCNVYNYYKPWLQNAQVLYLKLLSFAPEKLHKPKNYNRNISNLCIKGLKFLNLLVSRNILN